MSEGIRKSERHEVAEDLFCEYLRVRTAGSSDFDDFCVKHPDYESELRELHTQWSRVHLILERLGGSISIVERLKDRFGEVDPGISLHEEAGDADGDPSFRLLDKLTARRPASTRYDIRGELGRGGMGIVYKVWDESLRRQLAMKVVLGKRDASAKTTQVKVEPRRMSRFLEEAQITGQLDHPGILPIHELGIDPDGRVYFTMRLVEGLELREVFSLARKNVGEWSRTRVLGVLLRVCEAMAFAHSKGVIHRDLKPANVMVARFGAVYVMDWGLAKVLGRDDSHDIRLREASAQDSDSEGGFVAPESLATERSDSSSADHEGLVTMDGDIIGTPSYMSPEQAGGQLDELGPRADVYSTGAMLYELLTGQMPYEPLGERVPAHTILNAVRTSAPWPVLDIAPETPPELVAISNKAMARNIEERYADMSEFASDLRAYLEGHVVTAYETGVAAEVKKWMERNKATGLVGAALILVLVASIATFIWQQQDTVYKLEAEKAARGEALELAHQRERQLLDEKVRTEQAVLEARENFHQAEFNKEEAKRQANNARNNAQQAQEQSREAHRKNYLAGLVAADYSLRLGEVDDAKRALAGCERGMRGWEWRFLDAQSDTSVGVFGEGREEVFYTQFVGLGQMVHASTDFRLRLIDLESGRVDGKITWRSGVVLPTERVQGAWAAVLHPGRRFIAAVTYNSDIALWDLRARKSELIPVPVRTYSGHDDDRSVRCLAISNDGRYLASAAGDHSVRVFDFETTESVAVLADLDRVPSNVKFCPTDSERLAFGMPDGTARIWDWSSGQDLRVLRAHIGAVNDLDWRPDGLQLATVSDDGTLRLWEAESGRLESTFSEHTGAVTAVAYGVRDGVVRVVTGSRDTTVRLWDTRVGRVLRLFAGHEATVRSVAFEDGGTRILSASNDGTVRLWSLLVSQGTEVISVRESEANTRVVQGSFDQKGARLLSAVERVRIDEDTGLERSSGEAIVWDRESGEVICSYETEAKMVAAAFVEGGSAFACLLAPSAELPTRDLHAVRVVVVSAESGKYLRDLPIGESREPYVLAATRDGSKIAVGGADRIVSILDVLSGEVLQRLEGHKRRVSALAFSADGRALASGSRDKTVRVWNVSSGDELRTFRGHQWQVNALAFDERGERLASCSNDRTARIWDLENGNLLQLLEGSGKPDFGLCFTPTGRRLLTGGADNLIRVYDVDSGELLLRMRGHSADIRSVVMAPDGSSVLSSSFDGTHRVWESRSARDRAKSSTSGGGQVGIEDR